MALLGKRVTWLVALVAALLALPAIGISAYLEYEVNTLAGVVQNERAGLDRLSAVETFKEAAAQYAIAASCGGSTATFRSRADSALDVISAQPFSASLGRDWNAATIYWQAARKTTPGPASLDEFFRELDSTLMSIGDDSSITYDGEFAGVSLADAISYRIPAAVTQLHSARFVLCITGPVPTIDDRLELKKRQVLFDKAVDDAVQDAADSVRVLAGRLDTTSLSAIQQQANIDAYNASGRLTHYTRTLQDRPDVERSLDRATASLNALSKAAFPVMDRILGARLAGYDRQRLIRLTPGLLGVLAAMLVAFLMVRLFSEHTALEVARQTAAEQERMAMHDGLTGIMNRRAFFSALERAVAGGTNSGAICVFDIDHFKEINDTFGHATGDDLLVRLATTIGESVRPTDAVARLGGDEFAVFVLPPIPRTEIERIVDRIASVMKLPVVIRDQEIRASVSIGVSFINGDTMRDVQEALERADAALYKAKTAARGSFLFSEGS